MGEQKRKEGASFFQIRLSKPFSTVLIVLLGVLIVVGLMQVQQSRKQALTVFEPARTKGPLEAPLQILEFADFQCPDCSQGSKVLNRFMKLYPEGIRLSVRYYPLGELNSMISAVYTECVSQQNQFWTYHDILFQRQSQWRTLAQADGYLKAVAKEVNINEEQLEQCVNGQQVRDLILGERSMGEAQFVKSTPTYFINGEMVIGAHNLQEYLMAFFEIKREDLL